MSFETEKNKVESVFNNDKTQSDDINALNKLTVINNPENVIKNIQVIHLIQNYNFTFGVVSVPFDSRITILAGGPDQIGVGGGEGG